VPWPALILLALIVWVLMITLFSPHINYRVTTPLPASSHDLLHIIQATCQASLHHQNRVEIFSGGAQSYLAMRDAIRSAQSSVNFEAYIFDPGDAANLLIDALVERARAGVAIRLVLDAIGSRGMYGPALDQLRDAGCQLHFYRPLRWHNPHRINNRTHRELLIVDGVLAFTGGAGVADRWYKAVGSIPPWRDTMARIEGPVVAALQGVFAENWLACGGEILTSPRDWPQPVPAGSAMAMVVKSSPADRATVSRVVFQMLIEGAASRVDICTPYFLPDRALRRALVGTARRGVHIRVIVPGWITDQRLVRLASRRMYGELLAAGVRIYEYRPTMIHAKALIVDDTWAVIGTTNIDNRSFEHNDEVNVAFADPAVTARLRSDFEADIASSDEVTIETWLARPVFEKIVGPVCWILERQQ